MRAHRVDTATHPPSERTVLGRALHASTRFPRLARLSKAVHVGIYRLTRGRIMGRWFGSPVLVLETVGRRTSKRRRATMTYCPVDADWVVVPINAGSPRTPGWWLNLSSAGEATVFVRGERVTVRARETHGAERQRLWSRYVGQAPVLEEFRAYASRDIPVVVLERP